MHNSDGICIDVNANGKLGIATLKSQFRHATGLKFMSGSQWVAVTIDHDDNFVIPESEKDFVVVTDTVGKPFDGEIFHRNTVYQGCSQT